MNPLQAMSDEEFFLGSPKNVSIASYKVFKTICQSLMIGGNIRQV